MGLTNRPPKKDQWPEPPELPPVSEEQSQVRLWRWKTARRAGLSFVECDLIADSNVDLERLRWLAQQGCAPELIFQILRD